MGMPDVLYKYRDLKNDYNRKTLFEFEIFLASTSLFNDPYEGSIPFVYDPVDLTPDKIFLKMRQMAQLEHPDWTEEEIHQECYNGQCKDLLNDDRHIEKFNEQNRKDIDKTFGILSLTIHPKNYLMWSHYANCHTGFCLGFDSTILFDTVGGSLGPVQYEKELPKLKLFGDTFDFHLKQLATKSIVWSYEDEYRLVKSQAAKKIFKYPKEMIKQIFLGVKMSWADKNEIIDFVKTKNIDCQIFELSLDRSTFELNHLNIY